MTSQPARWGYGGSEGPEHWGCLSDEYRPCSEGMEQSPVNITGWVPGPGAHIAFDYRTRATAARNNGHTVYLDFAAGNLLDVAGQRYELQGIHHHSPGEHQLDGESFAAELHLVHQDTAGNLAVVGLLFRQGDPSPLVQALLDAAPPTGVSVALSYGPDAADYVPNTLGYFGYDGSLTTPPCTEGVRWIVMQSIGTVSQEQAQQLQKLTHGRNNRPVQPIGSRTIIVSDGP